MSNTSGAEWSRDRISAARELFGLLPKEQQKRGPQKLTVEIQAPDWLRPKGGTPIGGGDSKGVIDMQALPPAAPADSLELDSGTS